MKFLYTHASDMQFIRADYARTAISQSSAVTGSIKTRCAAGRFLSKSMETLQTTDQFRLRV